MSSSPTVATSTTGSSTSSPSRPEGPLALVACGALAAHLRALARRCGIEAEVHSLPSLLHNRPERIAPAVEALVTSLQAEGRRVAVAYAACGTHGALDALCGRLGVARLAGEDCYEVLAGRERLRRLLEQEPGTYVLTDFLVASFSRSVRRELGLDRHPELRDDYFGHYRRAVWLAEEPTPALEAQARAAAEALGLPLEIVPVGLDGLEAALGGLVAASAPPEEAGSGVAGDGRRAWRAGVTGRRA